MKQPREFIVAEIVILSPEEGGKKTPLAVTAYEGQYRPHIVLQTREIREPKIELQNGQRRIADEYLGASFWKGPYPIPISAPFTMTMLLMYAPHPVYEAVVPGAEFTIREGPEIVGHGKVLSRSKEEPER